MSSNDTVTMKKHSTKAKLYLFLSPPPLLSQIVVGPSGKISSDISVCKINEQPYKLAKRMFSCSTCEM